MEATSSKMPAAFPASQGPAVSKRGDVWACGNHRIGCGDALEIEAVGTVLQGVQPVMSFIDCPYNLPIHGFVSGNGTTCHRDFANGSGEMSEEQFVAFLGQSLRVLRSVLA